MDAKSREVRYTIKLPLSDREKIIDELYGLIEESERGKVLDVLDDIRSIRRCGRVELTILDGTLTMVTYLLPSRPRR